MEDGGPSVTASRVAAHRLGFARVATDYGDPAAGEALAADVAAGRAAPANRMHDYLAARTSFFDRTITSALGRGVGQVVVGAAGYDGRAFRYAKPDVRWFGVDHPATQRDKLERLGRLGIDASHVRFVAADFTRDPVADRLRDLPALTGTSKEAVRWALGILTRSGLAAEEPDPAASRGKVVRLTPRGLDAQRVYPELAGAIERRWHERFTHGETGELRACLEPLAAGDPPPLFAGLEPHPDNWRASVRPPVTLPHFPMVLHRGGYPDGS